MREVIKKFDKKIQSVHELTNTDVKRIKTISRQMDKIEKDIVKESKHIDKYNSLVTQIEALKHEVDLIKKRG